MVKVIENNEGRSSFESQKGVMAVDDNYCSVNRGSMEKEHNISMPVTSQVSTVEDIGETTTSRDKHGLAVGTTSFFILGEIAGSGAVALPYAIRGTGYMGIVLMVTFCGMAAYTGILLAKCWIMMEERYAACRQVQRKPYQLMGEVCFGNWLSIIITVLIQINLLGACVVYSLLISGMLQDLFKNIWGVSICYWDLIVVGLFVPLTWFGSPKDFWPLAVIAAVTIIIASLVTTVQCIIDSVDITHTNYPEPTFKSFSLAFGTILFAFGGAVTFPTFQNDMKERKKFPMAVSIGFTGTLCVYLPVACAGYFVYGDLVASNITMNLSNTPVRIAVQSCMILHLFCAAVLLSNPCFQNLEDILKMRSGTSVWKILFRTCVVMVILFIGESVPKFSVILDLLGGSINPILCFILPILFYIKLVLTQDAEEFKDLNLKKRKIPLFEWAVMIEFLIISTLGGIAATVSAVDELIQPDALSMPCYVQLSPPLPTTS